MGEGGWGGSQAVRGWQLKSDLGLDRQHDRIVREDTGFARRGHRWGRVRREARARRRNDRSTTVSAEGWTTYLQTKRPGKHRWTTRAERQMDPGGPPGALRKVTYAGHLSTGHTSWAEPAPPPPRGSRTFCAGDSAAASRADDGVDGEIWRCGRWAEQMHPRGLDPHCASAAAAACHPLHNRAGAVPARARLPGNRGHSNHLHGWSSSRSAISQAATEMICPVYSLVTCACPDGSRICQQRIIPEAGPSPCDFTERAPGCTSKRNFLRHMHRVSTPNAWQIIAHVLGLYSDIQRSSALPLCHDASSTPMVMIYA
nr:hypothetical protein CFP56_16565 [Quercus suber]